jgi:hypothetical protein
MKKNIAIVALAILAAFLYTQSVLPDWGHGCNETGGPKAREAAVWIATNIGHLSKSMQIDQWGTHQTVLTHGTVYMYIDRSPNDPVLVYDAIPLPHMSIANGASFAAWPWEDPKEMAERAVQHFKEMGFPDARIGFTDGAGKLFVVECRSALVHNSMIFRKWGPLM